MRVGTNHSALCLLNHRIPSVRMRYWLGLLLSRDCRMGWAFQLSWEISFCNSLWTPDSKTFFRFGESQFVYEVLNFLSLWWYPLRWNDSAKEFNFSDSKVALFNCQFQFCWVYALEDCPNVPGKPRSINGYNSNVVHVLSTLVSVNNWVQVFAHEALKSRHRSVDTLWKSFVGKGSAGKIECEHFHWVLVRHLQTVINLEAIKLAE